MKASIVLPSYRRYQPLLNTISDLLRQNSDDFEIIVVDQNLEWPSEYVKERDSFKTHSKIVWITLDRAEVVLARNIAVNKAKGDVLIFIDDDVKIPDPFFVEKHLKNYEDHTINIVIGRECQAGFKENDQTNETSEANQLRHLSFSSLQQALWFDRNSTLPTKVCTFSTCNGSMRKSVFLEVSGFDENYQGNSYGDDYDLILRLNKLGYIGVYDPQAWLIHLRVPMGGLRMSDVTNKVDYARTSTGFWIFFLRHGEKGMYSHLFYNHILRKTVLMKTNLKRPWREIPVILGLILGFFRAYKLVQKGVDSPFLNH
ncbi:glycosyltransferase family 2 protein [Picosynechococcus sp. PCC 11901]|nr:MULTISPECIES: glycosyltransferase family 2 protein [unclassified Picosynechococcus]QCS50070.1 glycosyltransferase family 2 protein [Picosynechococcus sp. PCC 11901]